jgi:hypothetical protein
VRVGQIDGGYYGTKLKKAMLRHQMPRRTVVFAAHKPRVPDCEQL